MPQDFGHHNPADGFASPAVDDLCGADKRFQGFANLADLLQV